MKNLSLFVTLGLISLMGAFTPVNSGTPTNEDPNSVILESLEETATEGINVELEDSTLEAQVEDEIPVVDGGSSNGEFGNTTIGSEEDAEIEASEINSDENGDVILPATDNAEIPTGEESAEVVEPAE